MHPTTVTLIPGGVVFVAPPEIQTNMSRAQAQARIARGLLWALNASVGGCPNCRRSTCGPFRRLTIFNPDEDQ